MYFFCPPHSEYASKQPVMSIQFNLAHGLETRTIESSDYDFLYQLYASTRVDEMVSMGWSEEEQHAFLTQQFEFQHRYYQEHFSDAQFWVLLREAVPIGRLYWWVRNKHAALIDLSLMPAWREQEIGTAVIQSLVEHADKHGLTISLYVESTNPAYRLYLLFGFEVVRDNGMHLKMRRHAREKYA